MRQTEQFCRSYYDSPHREVAAAVAAAGRPSGGPERRPRCVFEQPTLTIQRNLWAVCVARCCVCSCLQSRTPARRRRKRVEREGRPQALPSRKRHLGGSAGAAAGARGARVRGHSRRARRAARACGSAGVRGSRRERRRPVLARCGPAGARSREIVTPNSPHDESVTPNLAVVGP